MKYAEVFFLAYFIGRVSSDCTVTPVQRLLDGCPNLKGLVVVSSTGRTVVNDNNCGDFQSISEFSNEPYFRFAAASSSKMYTLLLVDPDAPLMTQNQVFLHMLRANIPGSAVSAYDCCINKGNNYNDYRSPTPYAGTGAHRYIGLLYLNDDGYQVQARDAPAVRNNFELGTFVRDTRLCGPVAATEFRLQAQ